MSIVALKRKTAARYGPHSAAGGFSLNGNTRFKGPGQVSLAESVTRTPFRGTAPMGHGGGARCRVRGIKGRAAKCNSAGEYVVQVHDSGSCCTVDPSVKRSSMSTAGMLEKRYLCTATYPCNWVKQSIPDSRPIVRYCPIKATVDTNKCHYTGFTKDQNVHTLNYEQYKVQRVATAMLCMKPVFPFAVRQPCAKNYLRAPK